MLEAANPAGGGIDVEITGPMNGADGETVVVCRCEDLGNIHPPALRLRVKFPGVQIDIQLAGQGATQRVHCKLREGQAILGHLEITSSIDILAVKPDVGQVHLRPTEVPVAGPLPRLIPGTTGEINGAAGIFGLAHHGIDIVQGNSSAIAKAPIIQAGKGGQAGAQVHLGMRQLPAQLVERKCVAGEGELQSHVGAKRQVAVSDQQHAVPRGSAHVGCAAATDLSPAVDQSKLKIVGLHCQRYAHIIENATAVVEPQMSDLQVE